MRLRITEDFGPYRKGQVIKLPKAEAELLIKQGVAVFTKDMRNADIKHG